MPLHNPRLNGRGREREKKAQTKMSAALLYGLPIPPCWPLCPRGSTEEAVLEHEKKHELILKVKPREEKAVRLVLIEFSQGPVTIDGRFFQGHTFTPLGSIGVGTFDTPLFNAETRGRLVGRLVGFYIVFLATGSVPSIAVGTWNFELFSRASPQDDERAWETKKQVKHWITASTGFNTSINVPSTEIPNVILNGTGDFLGVNGEVANKVIAPGEPGYDSLIPKIRWTLTLRK